MCHESPGAGRCGQALGRESAEPGLMTRPPRPAAQGVSSRDMLIRAWGYLGLVCAALVMTAFFYVLWRAGWHPGVPAGEGHPLHQAYLTATTATSLVWLRARSAPLWLPAPNTPCERSRRGLRLPQVAACFRASGDGSTRSPRSRCAAAALRSGRRNLLARRVIWGAEKPSGSGSRGAAMRPGYPTLTSSR
ncbi:cation-translocating P-type ATPase C-terminal domain-containing protein [Nonomuraea jabiensis]|uniref:cation-translocating P-type ATPase C-terminal domain-containing protein n=1 Tax=Nonomuraea jabiensis TaxID=882448 RepID=UPI003D7518D1